MGYLAKLVGLREILLALNVTLDFTWVFNLSDFHHTLKIDSI